jgi:hypothetical protein
LRADPSEEEEEAPALDMAAGDTRAVAISWGR